MAEFQEVMKQLNRMCDAHPACDDCECPMRTMRCCGNIAMHCSEPLQAERIEKAVMDWAAEHPEPVYPTWLEWMTQQGLCRSELGYYTNAPLEYQKKTAAMYRENYILFNGERVYLVTEDAMKPIPADIAQKLWIRPKNGHKILFDAINKIEMPKEG